jgi:hypothetical protein
MAEIYATCIYIGYTKRQFYFRLGRRKATAHRKQTEPRGLVECVVRRYPSDRSLSEGIVAFRGLVDG